MNTTELQLILSQPEGIKLDFKREYKLGKTPPNGTDTQKRRNYVNGQWDEFIKDIIALTNGNVGTAYQVGRLVIGVDDKISSDGTRQLYDTSYMQLTSQQIMAKVNSACEPPIADLYCEPVAVDGIVNQWC
ncbi:MAG: ATP-binding protein [Chloroflexota bacterium]|nr:ATP-binding protein [Chloroflexota bacterium]